jgi:hypothetical protein
VNFQSALEHANGDVFAAIVVFHTARSYRPFAATRQELYVAAWLKNYRTAPERVPGEIERIAPMLRELGIAVEETAGVKGKVAWAFSLTADSPLLPDPGPVAA